MCAQLLCTILRQFNCSTTWAKNGQEAIDLLRTDPTAYDLILMDLRMPVMDGLSATKIIKGEMHLNTPVVALTGEGGAQIQEQCKQIGFNAYYNKPLKKEQLVKVIQEQTGYDHSKTKQSEKPAIPITSAKVVTMEQISQQMILNKPRPVRRNPSPIATADQSEKTVVPITPAKVASNGPKAIEQLSV